MKTKNKVILGAFLVSAATLGVASTALAQSDSQKSATTSKRHKPAPKKEKVWTNDDFASVSTPADAKDNTAPASGQSGAANSTASANQHKGGVPPVLTNPKSLEDADKMIAWEHRDIAAQEEFLVKVQQEIDEAPADQKDRLTKLLEDRTKILASTRTELKNLETKKKAMEKPPAENTAAASEPPSQ